MTRTPILQPGQSYTFPQYFELPFEPDDILAELGYALGAELDLVRYSGQLDRLEESQRRIRENLLYASLYRIPADFEELMRILVAILA